MIYLMENTAGLAEDFVAAAFPYLSTQRKEKINSLRSVHDRADGCAVYLLLRLGLIREYGISEAPEFTFGEHGKPMLKDHPAIHFNMSHSKAAVCCILSDSETAVDITDFRQVRPGVIRRVCSPEEQSLLKKSADPQTDFLGLWTRKECLSKLSGKGMSESFAGLTDRTAGAEHLHTVRSEGYIMTYFSHREEKTIIINEEELFESLSSVH